MIVMLVLVMATAKCHSIGSDVKSSIGSSDRNGKSSCYWSYDSGDQGTFIIFAALLPIPSTFMVLRQGRSQAVLALQRGVPQSQRSAGKWPGNWAPQGTQSRAQRIASQ